MCSRSNKHSYTHIHIRPNPKNTHATCFLNLTEFLIFSCCRTDTSNYSLFVFLFVLIWLNFWPNPQRVFFIRYYMLNKGNLPAQCIIKLIITFMSIWVLPKDVTPKPGLQVLCVMQNSTTRWKPGAHSHSWSWVLLHCCFTSCLSLHT